MIDEHNNEPDGSEEVKGVMPQEGDSDVTQSTEVDKAQNAPSLEAALAELNALKEEKTKNAELLNKLRKFEKENKAKAESEMKAKGEYQKLYEEQVAKFAELEGKLREKAINSTLNSALKTSGVDEKMISTAMKLVDKAGIEVNGDEADAKSIERAIKALQKSDPGLFGEVEKASAPSVKRAAEGAPVAGYEKELRACKTMDEIKAVNRKYGK